MQRLAAFQFLGAALRRYHAQAGDSEDGESEQEDSEQNSSQRRQEGAGPSRGCQQDSPLQSQEHAGLMQPATSPRSGPEAGNLHKMLDQREQGPAAFRRASKCHISQQYPPNKLAGNAGEFSNQAFCGQFSKDGEVFMSACQDHHIRLYHTPHLLSKKPFKDVHARDVGWSIVDTDFSPDQRMLIYSSWSNYVHICNVYGEYELHEGLDFRPLAQHFCLFSIKFSPDNREIIGGSSDDSLYIYDIETKKPVMTVVAHGDDVNSVCFVDESPHTILTASDDTFCKVWDRRELKPSTSQPVGVLAGHADGITHVSSKGDGRYLITNSKDQTCKLWDLRKMVPPESVSRGSRACRRQWDYRWEVHRDRDRASPNKDASLMTYKGHRVLQTLVRAYFSPLASTGQRYIYTGSTCGSVFVYDVITGQRVRRLTGHYATVRDVSWHPTLPILATSSWDCSVGVWEHYRGSDE